MRLLVADRTPGSAVLVWGVRTLGWFVVTCALVGGLLLPLLIAAGAPRYESSALVVGQELEIDSAALPRFADAVFHSDEMTERTANAAGFSGDVKNLIPDRIDLIAAEDSIVLQVLGRADDPGEAARFADVAATAFVGELNEAGSGVGSFAVQSEANVPRDEVEGPPAPLTSVVGAGAAAVLGACVVALVAAVRRPMLQAADVESTIGTRVLGAVVTPAAPGSRFPDPRRSVGIPAVARAMLQTPDATLAFASSPHAVALRQRLLVLVASSLSRFCDVTMIAPTELHEAVEENLGRHPTMGHAEPPAQVRGEMLVIDGIASAETDGERHEPMGTVLVIAYGTPARRVRDLTAGYLGSEIVGAVLVDQRRALLRPSTRARGPQRIAKLGPGRPAARPADPGRFLTADTARPDAVRPPR